MLAFVLFSRLPGGAIKILKSRLCLREKNAMKRSVAIIAPFVDPLLNRTVDADLILRLKRDRREFTLGLLFEMAANSYDVSKCIDRPSYYDTVGAAGFYLSSILREAGYDTVLTAKADDETLASIATSNPFAVCISSTMILTKASMKEVVDRVRASLPRVPIIIGGVFVWKSFCWHETLQAAPKTNAADASYGRQDVFLFPCAKTEIDADALVVSQHGKIELLRVLRELERGAKADLSAIPNLAIPDAKGSFFFTNRTQDAADYNADYTRWDLLDALPSRIPIRTSVGCAYRCAFCDFWHCYPQLFLRTTESLSAELKLVRAISRTNRAGGIIHITDDNVFCSPRRARDICSTLIEAKTGMFWVGFLRGSSVRPDNIDIVRRSGLLATEIGVESGDSDQLKRMKKGHRLDQVRTGIELLDAAGVSVLMTFVVGFPGETELSLNNTVGFVNELNLQRATSGYQMFPALITPLSSVSKQTSRARWRLQGMWDRWSHVTMNAEQALDACYKAFKNIDNVPYYHHNESRFFNMRFDRQRKIKLYRLRRDLTVQLMEGRPWHQVEQTFQHINRALGFEPIGVPAGFREEILLPSRQPA